MKAPAPITPDSKADLTPARKACTRVLARLDVLSLDVCRAGEVVALHLYTASGEVVAHLSEAAFAKACRGTTDSNGNPYRDHVLVSAEVRLAREAATPPPPPLNSARRIPDDEVLRRNEVAWKAYVSGEARTLGAAAKLAGCNYVTFSQWVRFNHAETAREIRRSRGRSFK